MNSFSLSKCQRGNECYQWIEKQKVLNCLKIIKTHSFNITMYLFVQNYLDISSSVLVFFTKTNIASTRNMFTFHNKVC